jgi:hypothetical protein
MVHFFVLLLFEGYFGMSIENVDDKIDRLRSMSKPGQQTWDLSPNDVEAIRLAVNVLSVIQAADEDHGGNLDVYDIDTSEDEDKEENQKMLNIGNSEFYGSTVMECFVKAGESLC